MPVRITGYQLGNIFLSTIPNAQETVLNVFEAGVFVEMSLATILATIAGSDGISAVTLLRQLRSTMDQHKAVLAIAKLRLPPDDVELVRTVQRALEAHRKRRNSFAHNCWAHSPDIKNAVFLMRSADIIQTQARMIAPKGAMPLSDLFITVHESDVYGPNEFALVRQEAAEARTMMVHLSHYVLASHHPTSDEMTQTQAQESKRLLTKVPAFQNAQRNSRRRSDGDESGDT